MARTTRSPQRAVAAPVTLERAARLYRLLNLVGRKPQSRDALAKALKLGIRGFYRDLEALRDAHIEVALRDRRYSLAGKLSDATSRLPFPDPGLTLGEATQLARGKSKAHQKLQKQVKLVAKPDVRTPKSKSQSRSNKRKSK